LADGFSFFESRHLQNLETGQAIARVERSDFDFNLTIPLPTEPNEGQARERREQVITASRKKYGTPRAQLEAAQAEQQTSIAQSENRAPEAQLRTPDSGSSISKSNSSHVKETRVPHEQPAPAVEPAASFPFVVREPTPPTVSERKQSISPADMGRGGAQHQAIQKRIKQAAESFGFRSTIEKPILNGQGSIDLLLERNDRTFACEISISTTIDHEVGNVSKCLKAGFTSIAVICLDEERLQKIEAAVSGSIGAENATAVSYYLPDRFITLLQPPAPPPAQPMPQTEGQRRGWKIKRSMPALTREEQKQREEDAIRLIAQTMRKKS
jgi:hypothetical protein